jgi:hypothetical protein
MTRKKKEKMRKMKKKLFLKKYEKNGRNPNFRVRA